MLELLLNIIGTILYPLFNIIFVLINLFQSIFRGFAGVEDVHYGAEMGFSSEVISGGNANNNTGELKNTGIVYYLLQSDLVKNMFFSMVILGLFLIIMFTFIATIKNVYSSKPKPWQELAGKAMIGLVN